MPYVLNGNSVALGDAPVVKGGVTYVPWRDVVEALGGSVSWDNAAKEATGTIAQWTCRFSLGDTSADVNGTTVQIAGAPYVEGGTLYVPADLFRAAYGYKVSAAGSDVNIGL